MVQEKNVGLVVVGPEDLLAEGISDYLTKEGIHCFGPSAKAARIESSKSYAKNLMIKNKVPTARWAQFDNSAEACEFIKSADFDALVIKADGLASGKGVHVATNADEACDVCRKFLNDRLFGDASSTIVVEELLEGYEISLLCFSDGKNIAVMPPCQDHKKLKEGDLGPNTGGMGAYCPCHLISIEDIEQIKVSVLQTMVDALRSEGSEFIGVLYAGLMMTKLGPKVLEFNCRFGDPETQVLMMLLDSDLHDVLLQCVQCRLDPNSVKFDSSRFAAVVVVTSEGYPENPVTNLPVKIKNHKSAKIFWAGAQLQPNRPEEKSCNGTNYNSTNELFNNQQIHSNIKNEIDNISDNDNLKTSTSNADNDLNLIGNIVTTGGRVLSVVAVATSLEGCCATAVSVAGEVELRGKQFRKDIGWQSLKSIGPTYKSSGVDVEKADGLVSRIKQLAKSTTRLGCLSDIGSFGGLFDLTELKKYKRPVLVSGTDGVGTKLEIAKSMTSYRGLGVDLVAMCVNDVLCHGAEPLFFLDYFATGYLDVEIAGQVIAGIAEGCERAGCALIGGETAEMPGVYKEGGIDLAGFAVGIVEKDDILPSSTNPVAAGDVILGLASSGIHSNGFSLVRRLVEDFDLKDSASFQTSTSLGNVLLTPTLIYVREILTILKEFKVKALAHITGGGLPGNVCRVLPNNLAVQIDATKWVVLDVFKWICCTGNVSTTEMVKTFNCGIGMVAIVDSNSAESLRLKLADLNYTAYAIGHVVNHMEGYEKVEILNLDKAFGISQIPKNLESAKNVAVLISGTGTNLGSLINHFNLKNNKYAKIRLVISNVPNVAGINLALSHHIATKVINHKDYVSRQAFEFQLNLELEYASIDIICLAGFMRVLTNEFVAKWNGRLLNIHPSLLPSFKGMHPQRQAIDAGVTVTGCTVHFVSAEVDCGPIVLQSPVPVQPNDDVDTLTQRIKLSEHRLYPNALQLVASGRILLDEGGKLCRADLDIDN